MAVVNNIKEIREHRGIYQDELAEATGYCTKTIGRIERGESTPSAEFMLRISKYFNMLVEDVFHVEDWAGDKTPSSFTDKSPSKTYTQKSYILYLSVDNSDYNCFYHNVLDGCPTKNSHNFYFPLTKMNIF